MGSLAGSRMACLSRCRERIKLTIGCYAARRACFGRRLFSAWAADFQVFSEWATKMTRFPPVTVESAPTPGRVTVHMVWPEGNPLVFQRDVWSCKEFPNEVNRNAGNFWYRTRSAGHRRNARRERPR